MVIDKYEELVARMNARLREYGEIADVTTPDEDWSIKELVAHLIDSASNNHQRFIRLQQAGELLFPGYDAEEWRRTSKAKGMDYALLVDLWYAYNRFLLGIIASVDEDALKNAWVSGDGRKSLGFLIEDYYAHLLWHEELFLKIKRTIDESR